MIAMASRCGPVGGERIWRALNNPPRTVASAFADHNPKGYGALQRDRVFDHYLDGVFYDKRPSLWVEPKSDWGSGAVQLIEIPTDDEIHDNVVATWGAIRPRQGRQQIRLRLQALLAGGRALSLPARALRRDAHGAWRPAGPPPAGGGPQVHGGIFGRPAGDTALRHQAHDGPVDPHAAISPTTNIPRPCRTGSSDTGAPSSTSSSTGPIRSSSNAS